MSGIEKLGGTDRNYVKVAAGGRWCRNRRVTRCRPLHHTALLEMPACLPAVCISGSGVGVGTQYGGLLRVCSSRCQFSKILNSCAGVLASCDSLHATKWLSDGLASYHVGLSVSEQLLIECVPRRKHHLSRL